MQPGCESFHRHDILVSELLQSNMSRIHELQVDIPSIDASAFGPFMTEMIVKNTKCYKVAESRTCFFSSRFRSRQTIGF
jgi:hypothetical protein